MKLYSAIPGLLTDANGHGEHVASIAAGKSAQDIESGVNFEGMAPDADLSSIKAMGLVLGVGRDSDVIRAFEIASNLQCEIINLSLGSSDVPQTLEDDPLESVITQLTSNGTIIVASAGNNGPQPETITSPGCCTDAITVGAWDEFNGGVTAWSSRGPSLGQVKPDIVAPGVDVDSALIGILGAQSDNPTQRFGYLSGTSQAAPHVTGLLACVKQMFKANGIQLTTSLVKQIFASYGQAKNNDVGYGLIDWSMFENYLKR
jgi:subtilisin family serine protease